VTLATLKIDIDIAEDIQLTAYPEYNEAISTLDRLCKHVCKYADLTSNATCTVRFVSTEESTNLNNTYRDKNSPTNVLSFPAEIPDYIKSDFIGDIAVCLDVVNTEAHQQNKCSSNHLIHIILHGILHLLDYDHITEEDAEVMEKYEKLVLSQLGIDDPYQVQ